MKFEITKEQIEELYDLSKKTNIEQALNRLLCNWFPEAFEKELNKWYSLKDDTRNILMFFETNREAYGFDTQRYWQDLQHGFDLNCFEWRLATTEEVEAALITEAKKRGFKEGVYCKSFEFNQIERTAKGQYSFGKKQEYIYYGGVKIFNKGVWAEIIPTITKQEAEEKLKCKIV